MTDLSKCTRQYLTLAEYPGAKDIPGIPSADPIDGELYLALLKSIRRKLPASKTLSIAAPASYWYLKAFPIAEIAKVVDYIVYMTYDLHGKHLTPTSFPCISMSPCMLC
jgi:GH18 family chitinase